jgi:hypothetical protein
MSYYKFGISLQQQLTGTHRELQQSIQKLAQVVKAAAEEAARGIKELENSKQAIRQLIALLGDNSKPGLLFLSLSPSFKFQSFVLSFDQTFPISLDFNNLSNVFLFRHFV